MIGPDLFTIKAKLPLCQMIQLWVLNDQFVGSLTEVRLKPAEDRQLQ